MKPNWDDAPEWANWLAMDSDGSWLWHQERPFQMVGEHAGGKDYWAENGLCELAAEPISPEWMDTLEPRP